MAAVDEWRWFGTPSMFERVGFKHVAPLGTSGVLIRRTISPSRTDLMFSLELEEVGTDFSYFQKPYDGCTGALGLEKIPRIPPALPRIWPRETPTNMVGQHASVSLYKGTLRTPTQPSNDAKSVAMLQRILTDWDRIPKPEAAMIGPRTMKAIWVGGPATSPDVVSPRNNVYAPATTANHGAVSE